MIVRLKGVKKVRAKGRTYYYHRRTMTRIEAAPGTPEFLSQFQKIEAANPAHADDHGSLAWLIRLYRGGTAPNGEQVEPSPEWQRLAPRTKADYDGIFDWMGDGKAEPIDTFTPAFVLRLRDKAHRKKGRRFANYLLDVLSLVFNWGIPREHATSNPAALIEHVRKPTGAPVANRRWEPEERRIVMHRARGGLRVGIGLAMYAGLDRGDVVRWKPSGYTGQRIVGRRKKNGGQINVKAHRELREILDALPKDGRKTLVLNRHGRPYTDNGFTGSFFKLIRALEAEGLVADGLTLHGLRHTVGALLGEEWGNARGIARALGDKTETMGRHYSEQADMTAKVDQAMDKIADQLAVKPRRRARRKAAS